MKIAPPNLGPTEETRAEIVLPEWANFLRGLFAALAGWNSSLTASATLDFGSIPGQTQTYSDITVKGARPSNGDRPADAVLVTPSADTAGIIYTGVVTAGDTVRVFAKNFTAAAVNPPSTDFRIIVFQN